jgi:molybdopterin-guanine dinucleotide biosynthesis protein
MAFRRQVTSARLPTLWVCGPPGVGKTTVGWELFSQLTRAGVRAGYVDVDQLGICYPEPASDPGRHRLKVGNLDPIAANFGVQRHPTRLSCQAAGS